MQIGTPGSAYGPGQVMSRPTLGQAITPLPGRGDVIGTAVSRAAGVRPTPYDPGVLRRALTQALQLRGRARTPELASEHGRVQPIPAPALLSEHGGGMFVPPVQQGAVVPAFTVDPSMLLARARLAALMGGAVRQ